MIMLFIEKIRVPGAKVTAWPFKLASGKIDTFKIPRAPVLALSGKRRNKSCTTGSSLLIDWAKALVAGNRLPINPVPAKQSARLIVTLSLVIRARPRAIEAPTMKWCRCRTGGVGKEIFIARFYLAGLVVGLPRNRLFLKSDQW
jgi:hypothetical protein